MKVAGGTATPDIPATVFAMPRGMAIRYERPAEAIADWITGYHVYATRGADAVGQCDWFLPGTANGRITLDAGPIAVRIGNRRFDPLPQASLFGPTSRLLEAVTNGGVMIGFGISALGWARLSRRRAGDYHNRIAPLSQLLGAGAQRLTDALAALPESAEVAATLDALLQPLLGGPHPDEPAIRAFMAVLAEDGPTDAVTVAARVGVTTTALRRLAVRYFGMTPKLLLRRARFLRSFLRLFRTGNPDGYAAIDPSYYDASHFLRDADTFLGMTPRRFMALPTPFLDASVRARAAVLGAATQALHAID